MQLQTHIGCSDCETATAQNKLIKFPLANFERNYIIKNDLTSFFVPKNAVLNWSSIINSMVVFSETFQMMLATEEVLKKDWDNPIEDEAWACL